MTERDVIGDPKEPTVQTAFHIEGVPLISQRLQSWCGYASLAMVLQYWGTDIAPEDIFEYIHGKKFDEALERARRNEKKPTLAPTIDTLASVARELTPLETQIFDTKDYEKISKLGTPLEILQKFIKGKIPCIVRIPNHFLVATGVDTEKGTYIFNNSLGDNGSVKRMSAKGFEQMWDHVKPDYPRDTRHLMLAIYPKR